MNPSLEEALQSELPLKIEAAEFQDPALLLSGQGWSLSTLCPWRIRRGAHIEISWSSPDAADLVWDLIGLSIVGGSERGLDPAFDLSNGCVIDLFVDNATDPWILRLADITLVGPLERE